MKQDKDLKQSTNRPNLKHSKRLVIIYSILIFAAIIIVLAPYSSRVPEIEMRVLVEAIGIDKSENGVNCSVHLILPVQSGEGVGLRQVLDKDGQTLSDAINNINIALGREIELNHCALVVIGKDKAEEGILEECNYLLSTGIVSPEANLVVSGNKDAKEFVTKLNKFTTNMDISNFLRFTTSNAQNNSTGLLKFISQNNSKSKCGIIPFFKMAEQAQNDSSTKEEKDEDTAVSVSGGGADKSGGDDKEENEIVFENTNDVAIFKNGKCTNIWRQNDSQGLSCINKRSKDGILLIDEVEIAGKKIKNIPYIIKNKSICISARFKGEKPVFSYKINLRTELQERQKLSDLQYSADKKTVDSIEPALKNKIEEDFKKQINASVAAAKRDNCDVFLAEDYFFRQEFKNYKKYKSKNTAADFIDGIEYEIDVNVKINL